MGGLERIIATTLQPPSFGFSSSSTSVPEQVVSAVTPEITRITQPHQIPEIGGLNCSNNPGVWSSWKTVGICSAECGACGQVIFIFLSLHSLSLVGSHQKSCESSHNFTLFNLKSNEWSGGC